MANPAARRRSPGLLAPAVLFLASSLPLAATPPAGAARTGHYRNLLAEAGHSQAEIDARIQSTFQQLFHGDPATEAVFFPAGSNSNGPLAYLTDVANHDARTEGLSYGMMIAVQLNHKPEFDALWNWANTYSRITDPANPAVGFFSWSINTDGTPRSDSPATDGEEYFITSLLFAAHRWGNGTGLYNYQAQADQLLHLVRHHPVQTGTGPFRIHPADPPFLSPNPARRTPHPVTSGPMVSEQYSMVNFVPSVPGNGFTDPSYHLPAFYELWARWGPAEDRPFWHHAAAVSRHFFSAVTGPRTALSPDYSTFTAQPQPASFNPNATHFSYDSWRTVSNWSVDQSWWAANPDAPILSDRLQSFLISQGIHTFADQYTLDGKPLSTRHSTGMVATTAVGSLAATPGPNSNAFVNELWNTPIPSGEQRYFDGMLYLMSLLHTSGQFRVWNPTP